MLCFSQHSLAVLTVALVAAGTGGLAPTAWAESPPDATATLQPESAPRRTVAELQLALKQSPKPLIIDLRKEDAYAAGHITGAEWVPLKKLEQWAEDHRAALQDRPIYLYCACSTEQSSTAAVALLQDTFGIHTAYALKGGWAAWQEANSPVAKGSTVVPPQPASK